MFNSFKQFFKSRTPFHKQLLSTSLFTNTDHIQLEDLIYLIRQFEMNLNQIGEYFTIVAEEDQTTAHYYIRSKTLLTAHLILHEFKIGEEFATAFLEHKFLHLTSTSSSSLTILDKRGWLTENIHIPYFQYLQRLAANVQVFHCCKVNQYPQSGQLNIQTKVIWLFKISNIANFSFAQIERIKKTIVLNHDEVLLKEIVLVYWSDIMVYYNFLSHEVLKLLEYYRNLAVKICLQFYELYVQLIQLRNKVRNLYKNRQYFDQDNVIQHPILFDVKKGQMREVEKYVKVIHNNTILARQRSPMSERQNPKHSLSIKRERKDHPFDMNAYSVRQHYNQDMEDQDEDFDKVKEMFSNNIQRKLQNRLQTMEEVDEEEEPKKNSSAKKQMQVLSVLEGRGTRGASRHEETKKQ